MVPSGIRLSVSRDTAVGAIVLVNTLYFCPSRDTVLAKPTRPSLAVVDRNYNQSILCDFV